MGTESSRRYGCGVAGWVLAAALTSVANAQIPSVSLGSTNSGSTNATSATSTLTPVSRTVQGRVTNALDGAAIPRALVVLNSRSVLTDSQGRVEIPDFTDTQAFVTLTKPGFSQTNDMSMGNTRQRIANLDATLELKVYPNCTIMGTVTGRDGLPLTRVPVQLRRGVFDPQNGVRWITTHSVQTDLRGEYRFRDQAGRFQVAVGYVARAVDTGEAILPVTYPGNTSSDSQDYFEVGSGQERQIDLRPRTGLPYPVTVHVDSPEGQRGLQFSAVTSGGEAFQAASSGQASPGGMQVLLPMGTYTLHARLENKDASLEGSTRVTVTGKQTDAAVIHLEPAAILPVELAVDPASTQSSNSTSSLPSGVLGLPQQQPDLRQFNLRLHNLTQSTLPGMQDIQLRQNEDHGYEFRAGPGRYRLQAMGGGLWYIESATSGVTNLISSEIVISSGGSGAPIRIVVNNTQGMVSMTVKFATDTDMAYIYLIPRQPSLAQVNPIMIGNPGTASSTVSTRVAAGSYVAVALDHRVEEDLRNPDVISKFSTAAKTVDVSPSATATVELDIAQEKTQ